MLIIIKNEVCVCAVAASATKKKFAVTTNILELWELRCPPKIQYSVRILVIVRDRNFAACNYSHDAYARSLLSTTTACNRCVDHYPLA